MADILVVFGSKSDSAVYGRLCTGLKEHGADFEFHIASAHKSPEYLQQVVEESYDTKVVIAGAGLSAALPGVIASRLNVPVIGLPCDAALGGLDALLSMMQMPPGVPVLSVGVGKDSLAAEYAIRIASGLDDLVLNAPAEGAPGANDKTKKAVDLLNELNVPFTMNGQSGNGNSLCINLFEPEQGEPFGGMAINCLLGNFPGEDASLLLDLTKEGMWVGVNRAENAAIAAAEILNCEGTHTAKLQELRESYDSIIRTDDEEENAKWG